MGRLENPWFLIITLYVLFGAGTLTYVLVATRKHSKVADDFGLAVFALGKTMVILVCLLAWPGVLADMKRKVGGGED